MYCVLLSVLLLFIEASGKIYFKEEFNDDKWEDIWIPSQFSGKQWGKFVLTLGKVFGDKKISKGIKTSQDNRFYGLSAKFEPFNNKKNVLVMQFSVKHEQKPNCGGGYMKLFDCGLKPTNLHDDTPYIIMFGPDICGHGTKIVHVIFNYRGSNLSIKKQITYKNDELTHLYTLIVRPDNTYVVKIDNEKVEEGELENDWDFLLPRVIKDPNVKKPEDWIDDRDIVDPDHKKPEDWDKPEYIPDKTAVQPVDWDDDIDGDWEHPQIENPEYKGEWKPRLMSNLNYKGPWFHPEIDNPDYVPDPDLYKYDEICAVGFDLWQVESGTIFDNILIADDEEDAIRHAEVTWDVIKDKEREMKDKMDSGYEEGSDGEEKGYDDDEEEGYDDKQKTLDEVYPEEDSEFYGMYKHEEF